MAPWLTALLGGTLIAGVLSFLGVLIQRERWPANLRDAKRLAELIPGMDAGSQARKDAEELRDRLVSDWAKWRRRAPTDVSLRRSSVALYTTLAVSITLSFTGLAVTFFVHGTPVYLSVGLAFAGLIGFMVAAGIGYFSE